MEILPFPEHVEGQERRDSIARHMAAVAAAHTNGTCPCVCFTISVGEVSRPGVLQARSLRDRFTTTRDELTAYGKSHRRAPILLLGVHVTLSDASDVHRLLGAAQSFALVDVIIVTIRDPEALSGTRSGLFDSIIGPRQLLLVYLDNLIVAGTNPLGVLSPKALVLSTKILPKGRWAVLTSYAHWTGLAEPGRLAEVRRQFDSLQHHVMERVRVPILTSYVSHIETNEDALGLRSLRDVYALLGALCGCAGITQGSLYGTACKLLMLIFRSSLPAQLAMVRRVVPVEARAKRPRKPSKRAMEGGGLEWTEDVPLPIKKAPRLEL